MRTREIPKSNWAQTLAAIATHHAQGPVEVRIEGLELGDQPLARQLPLIGISLEQKGSAADAIELTLGDGQRSQLTHMIRHPAHVYLQEDDLGQIQGLDIEDGEQVKTLIFFGEHA